MTRAGGQLRSLFFSCVASLLCSLQAGCLQETAPPSVERSLAVLLALLDDDQPDVRRTAAESLGKIGDRSAIPGVLPLLTDSMPAVRAAAAQALGRIAGPDDQDVIVALSHALRDPSDRVRQAAALALGDVEPPPGRLALVADLLRSSDVQVRRTAVRALLMLDTGQLAIRLLPLLDDPDADVRQAAVAALGVSGDARAGAALGKRLAEDPSPAVRAEAAYHLGKSNGAEGPGILQKAMQAEADLGVRRWVEAELKASRGSD